MSVMQGINVFVIKRGTFAIKMDPVDAKRLSAHRKMAHRLLELNCCIFGGYIRDELRDPQLCPEDIDVVACSKWASVLFPRIKNTYFLSNPAEMRYDLLCAGEDCAAAEQCEAWLKTPVTQVVRFVRYINPWWGFDRVTSEELQVCLLRITCTVDETAVLLDVHLKLKHSVDYMCNGLTRCKGKPDGHVLASHWKGYPDALVNNARRDCVAGFAISNMPWCTPTEAREQKMIQKGFTVAKRRSDFAVAKQWSEFDDVVVFPPERVKRGPSRGLGRKFAANKRPVCLDAASWRDD